MVKRSFPGSLYFKNTRKNFKANLLLVVVLVVESEALYGVWLLQLACYGINFPKGHQMIRAAEQW